MRRDSLRRSLSEPLNVEKALMGAPVRCLPRTQGSRPDGRVMEMTMMIKTRLRAHSLALSLLMLMAAACQPDAPEPQRDDDASATSELDSELDCPEGQIPWRFPAAGAATNSEEYLASAETAKDGLTAIPGYAEINVQSVSCATSSLNDPALLARVSGRCKGARSCSVTTLCATSCPAGAASPGCAYSDATIQYTCGDTDAAGAPKVYTSTATQGTSGTFETTNELSCRGVNESLSKVNDNAGKVACIPAQCHGRARRNADMQCVVDDSKVEVVLSAEFGAITPAIETQDVQSKALAAKAVEEGKLPGPPLAINGTLKIPVTIQFANDLVPDEVKFTAWLEDEYIGAHEYSLSGETKRFRCVPFAFTLRASDPHTKSAGVRTYKKLVTTKFAEDCDGYANRKEFSELLKRSQISSFPQEDDFQQHLHLSYDMDGRTVWHKGLTLATASSLGDSEPECTPNPVAMFYDSANTTYNRSAYYEQRRVATYKPAGGKALYLGQAFSNRAQIGTRDIVARNEPVIRVFSNRRPTVSVDISWYMSNMNYSHVLNLERPQTRNFADGARKYLYAPRADVYIVPLGQTRAEREAQPPLHLGSVKLTDGVENGLFEGADDIVTQSAALQLSATVKQKMTRDATSPFFIPGTKGQFELFYCINATDGLLKRDAFTPLWTDPINSYRNETRWLANPQPGANNTTYDYIATYDLAHDIRRKNNGEAVNPAHQAGPFKAVWSLELESFSQEDHNPNAMPFKYRGCRTAKAPLVIYVDRFKTPVEPAERVAADVPASARTHTDFTDEQKSGDQSMSGNQDTGMQETCANGSSKDIYCSNTSNSGGRSDGEGGRPTMDLTSTIEHNPPQGEGGEPSIGAKFRGQLADFNALDIADLFNPANGVDEPKTSKRIEFTLTPNWENIAAVLNGADPSPVTEWDKGRFGGQDGLGFSLGYNTMFNIGPVPVFVTIKFTVGASVGISFTLALEPEEDDDQYECLAPDATEDCVVVSTEPASFADAVEDCSESGGRLSELQDAAEATKLRAALQDEGVTAAWIGAQLAYEKDTQVTEYRWMTDSAPFASDANGGTVRYFSNINIPNKRGLATFRETGAAVFYNPEAQELGAAKVEGDMPAALPYACTLRRATKEVYFEWATALKIGAGAGFGLEGCTPSPVAGFCLSASLNIVNAELAPTVGQTFRWLFDGAEPFARNGILYFKIPFTMSLFSGDVKAALKLALTFFELAIEWTIHSFDGIELFNIDLYEVTLPVLEDY